MAELKKVTKGNHLPEEGDGRFPVYSKQFNELVDTLNQGTGDLSVNDVVVNGDLTVTGTTTLNGDLVLGDAAADSLTINATVTQGAPVNYSNATGITAFATGGQASATQLTEEINNVTTVATAGDSVKLPAAVAGLHIYVKNSGATALDIFPASSDSIDALAINLAVRIQPGSSMHFYAKDAIVWESSIDNSITLNSPTTVTGQLEIKASASAGNTVTTITNASQAAARTYTIPDAGASANFVMSEGNASIAGVKTFTDTTASSSKDTGSVILEGGIGVEKEIYAGLSINAGSSLSAVTTITGATVIGTTAVSTDTISERTAAVGVTVDSVLLKDGGVSNSGVTMVAAFYPQVVQNDIAAGTGGAIAVTNYLTTINTDGSDDAFTLANGTQIGQMKKILLVVDGGGNGVVTPATAFAGGTTATFGDAGDYLILQWSGAAWIVQENSGVTIA